MLLALWKHRSGTLILVVLGHIVAALLGLVMIALVHQSLFELSATPNATVSWLKHYNWLIYLGLLVPLFVISVASYRLLASLGADMLFAIRKTMAAQILSLPYQRQESMGPARIHALLTLDVDTINDSLRALPMLLFNIALLTCCLGYMLWLSISYFLLFLSILFMVSVCAWWLVRRSEYLLGALRDSQGDLYQSLDALVAGGKELSLNIVRRAFFEEKQLQHDCERMRTCTLASEKHISIMTNFVTLMIFVLLGILLLLGQSTWAAPLNVMVGFVIMTLFIRGPVLSISANLPILIKGNVAWQNIEKSGLSLDLSLEGHQSSALDNLAAPITFKTLQLSGVHFSYAKEQDDAFFELGPIELTVNKGELIFIIGGNGSGKSTLAKVLTGLYPSSKGSVYLDNHVVSDSVSLKALYSTVFFDFKLFSQAIDNHGKTVTDSTLTQWLERLELSHKVTVKNGMLSTLELSQGQRRRLALIIAYCENRPIILFDEWAADQDPHFRHVFYTELLPYLQAQGKTVIAITHDDRYFDHADKLYKLEAGKLMDIKQNYVASA